METQGLQLDVEGPRLWTAAWGTDCIAIGYVQATTTPGWVRVRCWEFRLSWPLIKRVLNHFMTPEMFEEMFNRKEDPSDGSAIHGH